MRAKSRRRQTKKARKSKRRSRSSRRQRGGAGSTQLPSNYSFSVVAKPQTGQLDDPDAVPTVMSEEFFTESSDANPETPAPA